MMWGDSPMRFWRDWLWLAALYGCALFPLWFALLVLWLPV